METVLLHKSAFLYVTSIFRLSSFVFANALLTGITKTFVPFYSSFPEIFRKLGLTFEEKAFYDILMHMRDVHNFEYGTDRKVGSLIINDKCKALAKKVKELIDTQSCFADWLSNTNVRAKLNQDLWFLLDENGYPPEWSDDVFDQVLDQVENYKEHQSAPRLYSVNTDYYPFMVAEP